VVHLLPTVAIAVVVTLTGLCGLRVLGMRLNGREGQERGFRTSKIKKKLRGTITSVFNMA
jgi:hypothetical protein